MTVFPGWQLKRNPVRPTPQAEAAPGTAEHLYQQALDLLGPRARPTLVAAYMQTAATLRLADELAGCRLALEENISAQRPDGK